MGAAGEQTEHSGGVGGVFGLAEDVVVEGDGGVGAEDGRAETCRQGRRSQASHEQGPGGTQCISRKTAWAFSRARRVT